jgi:hypothetical protein
LDWRWKWWREIGDGRVEQGMEVVKAAKIVGENNTKKHFGLENIYLIGGELYGKRVEIVEWNCGGNRWNWLEIMGHSGNIIQPFFIILERDDKQWKWKGENLLELRIGAKNL